MATLSSLNERAERGSLVGRMVRNVAWLLGGRGAAGAMSLVYLALAARALGPTRFGIFSMVIAYGGAVAGLAQFQSWQAVMRYGADHLRRGRPQRLARLIGFTATLDWLSGAAGAAVAVGGIVVAAPWLGWSAEQRHGAELFAAVLLLSTGATPTGVLRLFNRFDLLVVAETVGPLVRLAGAALVWTLHGGTGAMLGAWGAAALAESAAGWIAFASLRGPRIALGRRSFRRARRENRLIGGFMLKNSFAASLGALGQQAGTLAVGVSAGAAAAGGFRLAGKLADALAKPAQIVTRALYPELARLAAGGDPHALRRVAVRTTAAAASAAGGLVLLAWAAGPGLLTALSGGHFAFARPFLLPLAVAAAIDLVGVAFEPVLNVKGQAGQILLARTVGTASYLAALVVLVPHKGPAGACTAAIAGALSLRATLLFFAARSVIR